MAAAPNSIYFAKKFPHWTGPQAIPSKSIVVVLCGLRIRLGARQCKTAASGSLATPYHTSLRIPTVSHLSQVHWSFTWCCVKSFYSCLTKALPWYLLATVAGTIQLTNPTCFDEDNAYVRCAVTLHALAIGCMCCHGICNVPHSTALLSTTSARQCSFVGNLVTETLFWF